MAIDKYFLKSAVRILNKIRRDYRTNVATLGYPDLMVSETDLKNVGINLNKLERKICRHKYAQKIKSKT